MMEASIHYDLQEQRDLAASLGPRRAGIVEGVEMAIAPGNDEAKKTKVPGFSQTREVWEVYCTY
jgi:hypothetical protein